MMSLTRRKLFALVAAPLALVSKLKAKRTDPPSGKIVWHEDVWYRPGDDGLNGCDCFLCRKDGWTYFETGAVHPVSSFDAREWARTFVRAVKQNPVIATDEATMIGWFANAIMCGYDERSRCENRRREERRQWPVQVSAYREDGSLIDCVGLPPTTHRVMVANGQPNPIGIGADGTFRVV